VPYEGGGTISQFKAGIDSKLIIGLSSDAGSIIDAANHVSQSKFPVLLTLDFSNHNKRHHRHMLDGCFSCPATAQRSRVKPQSHDFLKSFFDRRELAGAGDVVEVITVERYWVHVHYIGVITFNVAVQFISNKGDVPSVNCSAGNNSVVSRPLVAEVSMKCVCL
jgi:hypothetical protein